MVTGGVFGYDTKFVILSVTSITIALVNVCIESDDAINSTTNEELVKRLFKPVTSIIYTGSELSPPLSPGPKFNPSLIKVA